MGKTLREPLSYESAELQLSVANEYVADDELYIINILCLHDARERYAVSEESDLEKLISRLEETVSNYEKVINARNA